MASVIWLVRRFLETATEYVHLHFMFIGQHLVMRTLCFFAARKTRKCGLNLENLVYILGQGVQLNWNCITIFDFNKLQYLKFEGLVCHFFYWLKFRVPCGDFVICVL